MEFRIQIFCINFRERRFAAPGRPPEDKGKEVFLFNRNAKRLSRAREVLLPDEFVERRRPDSCGKRFHVFAV